MNRTGRLEQRIKKIQQLRARGMDDATIRSLVESEEYGRKVRNSIDWWDVIPVVYAVLLIGSCFVGIATHSQIAWRIFWYAFLFGIVVWLGQVFFGALGILGGIARWAGKQ